MDDAPVMCVLQGFDDLLGNGKRFIKRRGASGDSIRQRRSFDERQDQSTGVRRVHDSVDVSDVGMIERGQHLGFPLEASHAFGIAEEGRRQDLKRYVPLEHRVASAEHLPHTAFTQHGENFVVPEFVAHGKRHIRECSLVYPIRKPIDPVSCHSEKPMLSAQNGLGTEKRAWVRLRSLHRGHRQAAC